MKWARVALKLKVAQSCLTLCDPMDYSVHGILQARILEWATVPFSRGCSQTQGSNSGLPHCRQILYQLSHKGSRITELLIFSCAHLWCANNIICWGQSRKTRGTEHHVNGSVNSKCQLLLMQRTGLLLLLLLSCFSRVWLCVTPSTAAHPALLSLGFSRQEHWSRLPFPSPMPESEKWKWSRFSRVQPLATPWTAAYQAPPSMGFSRQEYWSGVPLPSPKKLAGNH